MTFWRIYYKNLLKPNSDGKEQILDSISEGQHILLIRKNIADIF